MEVDAPCHNDDDTKKLCKKQEADIETSFRSVFILCSLFGLHLLKSNKDDKECIISYPKLAIASVAIICSLVNVIAILMYESTPPGMKFHQQVTTLPLTSLPVNVHKESEGFVLSNYRGTSSLSQQQTISFFLPFLLRQLVCYTKQEIFQFPTEFGFGYLIMKIPYPAP